MDFDSSILNRVKQRLYGLENDPEAVSGDTQVIPSVEKSNIIHKETKQTKQKLAKPRNIALESTQKVKTAVILPQLELDPADFGLIPTTEQQTQSITEPTVTDLLTQVDTNNFESASKGLATQVIRQTETLFIGQAEPSFSSQTETYSVSSPLASISISKPAQKQLLEAEIAQTTLTDEENDLNDVANTTVDSSVQRNITTRVELHEIERELSEKKLAKNIQPAFSQNSFNPISNLLEAFQSDSEPEAALNSEKASDLSPTTSPIKAAAEKSDILLDDLDSDFEIPTALEALNSISPKKNKQSPISDYALRLKKQLLLSPTRAANNLITLDSSEDDSEEPIPSLTKEKKFLMKQKFSRKIPQNRPKKSDLFATLRRANAKQLLQMKKDNPDAELIEEIEKEEEEMGNLLERELERSRRIRKMEKQQEKARAALQKIADGNTGDLDDADYTPNEIPDSDGVMDSEEYDSEVEVSSKEESDDDSRTARRNRRAVLSDDDDEEEDEEAENGDIPTISSKAKSTDHRTDDSYMFGGPSSDNDEESQDKVTHIHSDQMRPETPISTEGFGETIQSKLFENLPPRTESSLSIEDSISANTTLDVPEIQSFQDLSTQYSFNNSILGNVNGMAENANDAEEPTQADYVPTQIDPTQILEHSDDEDEDFAVAVRLGRENVIKNNKILDEEQSDTESVDEKEKEKLYNEKVAAYEAKIRRQELKARKRRKDMERRGVKSVVEGEAEESEDEWKGIGGADNEVSDVENSEDERMIDRNYNIVLNDEEVRKKFMEQYQIKDKHELEKLIDDIKNHRLLKRARSSRFDVELSDEEDEILMAYRRKKLEEQKERLQVSKKVNSLLKSEKSKAFFDSITEESTPIIILDSDQDSDSEAASQLNQSQNDKGIKATETEEVLTDADEEAEPIKKVLRLDEAFVQKQLSFLCSTDESKYLQIQKEAEIQHGVEEEIEDLATLKSRCMTSLYLPESNSQSQSKRGPEVLTDDDEDNDDFGRIFKKPSMVSSFKLYHEKQVGQVSTGSFSGVTINKQYKVATGAKASITYMSKSGNAKATSRPVKSTHTQAIERRVDQTKLSSTLFKSRTGFT